MIMDTLTQWTKALLGCCTLIIPSCGYPVGVPDLACESMFPIGHQASASTTDPPPYNITVTRLSYKPGETLRVDVGSKNGEVFTGVYVQARRIGCRVNTTQTVGVFTCTTSLIETRHCFGNIHNAVSHTSGTEKHSVSFYWTAPVVSSGHVSLRATIVKNKSVFWTDVESAPLIDLLETDMPYCRDNLALEKKRFQDHSQNDNIVTTKSKYEDIVIRPRKSRYRNSGHRSSINAIILIFYIITFLST